MTGPILLSEFGQGSIEAVCGERQVAVFRPRQERPRDRRGLLPPTVEAAAEAMAWARMFAAAPDVLESLKQTLALARVKFGNLDPDANKVFERADAAIARSQL